ncbi:Arc family DNA-binding protein [Pseudomonas sp. EMN2]|uniref:Arc family DNA-binding protein n=1 Tax=Pseudomonas sp. EMN2 TaxID=2615212 RepID=UPI00129BD463|nr:Arc family DNA-binding protein [Pseudomonas sp. EMN2]
MATELSSIAMAALNRHLGIIKRGPVLPKKVDSRTADKFVIRGNEQLFSELAGLALLQGRSRNSEIAAAIVEGLGAFERSTAINESLKKSLGPEVSETVLAQVPDFQGGRAERDSKFVVRFPDAVREKVRTGLEDVCREGGVGQSMNSWYFKVLVRWINIQRQQYALLSAEIALSKAIAGQAEAPTKAVVFQI